MIGTESAEPSVAPAGTAARATARPRSWPGRPARPARLTIAALMLAGLAFRLVVARQSLFADELSTYWIVTQHGLAGVMDLLYSTGRIHHAEITPPLFFIASWLTSQIGHAPELVRLPSLIAGTLTIPAVYAVGRRTVGERAALLGAAFTTLSPFMIYYSGEARSYALMMLLVTLSTLCMLHALESHRAWWWVGYAACSFGAFYTHYTSGFLLAAQLMWLWWAHPDARRAALLANLGAGIALLPWVPGLIEDLNSPTAKILSALSPFTAHAVRESVEHWAIGFPYVEAGGLRSLPGVPALVLLGLATALVLAGLARAARGIARRPHDEQSRRIMLIALLAVSVPIGELIVSAFSTHLFGVRNLAASWPPLALIAGAAVIAAGPRLRVVAAILALAAFALAATKMLTTRYARPDYRAAAAYVASRARPGDVIIDATGVLSPGPLTGLDVALHTRGVVLRTGAPGEQDHPFTVFDRVSPAATVVNRATVLARGGRVFVVAYPPPDRRRLSVGPLPAPYRLTAARAYGDFVPLVVDVWSRGGGWR